ncbi:hypothetical protein ABZ891_13445 [Streptomyces sp. NPDC047023]|uniref:hypothetical protein n=1 Tax=Streptomyces sp. NPDC047023 TaxID=3155139 RepID=UPI0033D8B4AA
MNLIRDEADIRDDRKFHLVDYRYGHTYAVVRGFPELDDDAPAGSPDRVLDLYFAGVERISSNIYVGPVHVRRAGASDREALAARIGPINRDDVVFFLREHSTEDYVIATRLYWAEFDLTFGSLSPLASDDAQYIENHPPVEGLVRYSESVWPSRQTPCRCHS